MLDGLALWVPVKSIGQVQVNCLDMGYFKMKYQ